MAILFVAKFAANILKIGLQMKKRSGQDNFEYGFSVQKSHERGVNALNITK